MFLNSVAPQGCFIVISSLALYAYIGPGLTLLYYREEVHIIGLVAHPGVVSPQEDPHQALLPGRPWAQLGLH